MHLTAHNLCPPFLSDRNFPIAFQHARTQRFNVRYKAEKVFLKLFAWIPKLPSSPLYKSPHQRGFGVAHSLLTNSLWEQRRRRMKDAGKSHKANGKLSPETRKDRKSATGLSGSPKKGGHGGKFTWIGHGYEQVEMPHGAMDAKDPNFEDPVEIATVWSRWFPVARSVNSSNWRNVFFRVQ